MCAEPNLFRGCAQTGSTDATLTDEHGNRFMKQPDNGICAKMRMRDMPRHNHVPPFVHEVACHNESFPALLDEGRLWLLQPHAQVFVIT